MPLLSYHLHVPFDNTNDKCDLKAKITWSEGRRFTALPLTYLQDCGQMLLNQSSNAKNQVPTTPATRSMLYQAKASSVEITMSKEGNGLEVEMLVVSGRSNTTLVGSVSGNRLPLLIKGRNN